MKCPGQAYPVPHITKVYFDKLRFVIYTSGMNFVGRQRELAFLEEAWTGSKSAFIPVYGRRRVGKSELLVHFIEGRGGLYFVGKRAPAAAQIREFMETAARALDEPLFAQTRIENWKAALETVASRWKGKNKLVLVLDEFQWMVEASPELPSVIQELWDRQWSRNGRLFLVLCGSYLGFMEREVLGKESPLFGRRTGQLHLQPFNHLEAAGFHPRLPVDAQARIYAICGGIPAYLLALDGSLSVEQNITTRLLDDSAPLAREPEFLLREELRDLSPYHAILTSLAEGKTNPAGLAKGTGLDARALNYHLTTLMELGYVQRRYPISDGRPNLRSVRYALDDPLLRFWFRFIFPHQSLLRVLGAARGFTELVRPDLESYFGRCFERLCREALPLLYAAEGVQAAYQVGEYWDPKLQVDVVGLRQDRWTDLGECKWGTVSSLPALAAELEAKVAQYPNARNATIGRRLFIRASAARSKADVPDIRIHTLQDLYSLSWGNK